MSLLPGRLAGPSTMGAGGLAGTRSSRVSLNITLPPPGKCAIRPTLLIMLFDDSGSMLGGNDSTGLRYQEAALAVRAVGKRCRCGRERVAVLHMNRPTCGDLAPTPIRQRDWPAIENALEIPGDTDGASAITATLGRATQIAATHQDHQICLLVFSDFELIDNMHQLAFDLAAVPADVRAVAMRSQPPAVFDEFDRIAVTHIPTGQQPGMVAEAVFAALTDPRKSQVRRK